MIIDTKINGDTHTFYVNPNVKLMDFLRDEGFLGVKNGCSEGTCGSCTVLIDNRPLKSCIMFVGQIHRREVTTIEGLASQEDPHPLQDEFVKHGAIQCGYCIPGMILSANALLLRNPSPNDDEIKHDLDGNICRCTGYIKQIEAVRDAALRLQEDK